MKLKKNVLRLIKWVSLFLVVIVLAILTPFIMFHAWPLLAWPSPPAPEIKYAEFPFKLEYELNGEIFVVEDALICEFDGFGANYSRIEKFREWKLYLLSGKDRIILMQEEEIEIFVTAETLSWNGAKYYMGDPEGAYSEEYANLPSAWYKKDFDDERENAYIFPAEKMWERYKLRIISWEIADPIENTFR